MLFHFPFWGFPGGAVAKNPPVNARDARDMGSSLESGRSPEEGNGSSLMPEKFHNQRRLVGYGT